MRIQVRVTPAYQELHDHLESFDSEYRGKRLLALAAMQLAALGRNGVSDAPLLSNSIEALDNAYIRRFDLVLELPNPPRKQRERIIRDASGDRLGQALVSKLVEHEEMTPAVVTRAVQIGRGLHPRSSRALDATVETLVSATLKAQGFVTLDQSAQPALPEFYSPGLVNTDLPLEGLLGGLRQNPEARLCFYGPPGTGKTAFGHWLAQQLEKPLMVKRVSDLVAPFVGETEQNLARAFAAAQREDAVLLFDEVDSFLQDRKKARQSWEITAVNEMLTQMESYQGLFIASTNLMQDLDEASIRRFDLKIHFDYMKPQQIRDLFTSHLKAMKLKDPAGSAVNQLLGEGEVLHEALLNERQVRCSYYSAHNDRVRELTLNPLAIVQRGQVSYLIGTAVPYSDVRQYALHRFREAHLLQAPAEHLDTFRLDDYLATDAFQFGSSQTIERIQLTAWIDNGLAQVLSETPLSIDMRLEPLEDGYRLYSTVSDSWQLQWWLMSLGDSLTVEAPDELRFRIADKLRKALNRYEL